DTEGPARIAGQIELWTSRYAGSGNGRGVLGIVEALRIRRHPEPGYRRDAVFSSAARGAAGSVESRVFRPARTPVRIPKLLRYRADARLQPQHDPVRRGSLHSCQEG